MTENLPVEAARAEVAHRQPFFEMEPNDQVIYASKMATILRDIIEKQKLFSNIQGKNYVKVEGWQTLGTFLGIVARERAVNRLPNGSYEAFVDLIKFSDGTVVGSGSALCSVEEKRWGSADEYARRSMAITRATGKAFRAGFSWIITLAGYQPTPAEEMPGDDIRGVQRGGTDDSKASTSRSGKTLSEGTGETYTATTAQQERIKAHCIKEKIPESYWPHIDAQLMNKPFTANNVSKAIRASGFSVQEAAQ